VTIGVTANSCSIRERRLNASGTTERSGYCCDRNACICTISTRRFLPSTTKGGYRNFGKESQTASANSWRGPFRKVTVPGSTRPVVSMTKATTAAPGICLLSSSDGYFMWARTIGSLRLAVGTAVIPSGSLKLAKLLDGTSPGVDTFGLMAWDAHAAKSSAATATDGWKFKLPRIVSS
jgi:hypothetical protein